MDPQTSNKEVSVPSFQQHPTFRESMLVPLEILVEIFLLSLPPINLCQARQRTTLALVCRLWNDIIEATPILWSRISLSDGPSNVKRSLLKSAEYPIDIYGICAQRHADHDWCRHFFREVKRHTERWRCVELQEAYKEQPIAVAPTHSPFLESVKLRSIGRVEADDGYLTLVTSACAPRLRELVLDGMEFARWDISFPPTLSRLVLQHIRMSSPQILTVLAASPKLTVLHLSELYALERNDDMPDSATIELASLREMTFHVNPSDVIREVIARLKFPSDCKVSLACEIFDLETRASFLDPALSRYRETFQRVEEIIQVKISVPAHRVRVALRYLHWEITLVLMNRPAIRDTLEWFGISTNENAAASPLENLPIDSTLPISNVPILLEFDDHFRSYDLRYLDPVFDLRCITRIELKSDEYSSILSYLANPQILIQRATTRTAAAAGNQEPAENDGVAMRHTTGTWRLPGVRELSLQMGGSHVLRAVMKFVKERSSSGVGIGPNGSVLLQLSEARFPAGLKLVEFGAKDDTERRRYLGGVEALAWPSSLLNLLEILNEDAQVFWLGNRISKDWDHGLSVDDS